MDEDNEIATQVKSSSSCLSQLLILAVIIIIGSYALNGFKNPSDNYSQSVGGILGIGVEYPSKIMKYAGSALMKACKLPYSSDSECYKLLINSNGEEFTRINFYNGGYLIIADVECNILASFYKNDGDNRFFCTVHDTEGSEWDISLPTSNGDFISID